MHVNRTEIFLHGIVRSMYKRPFLELLEQYRNHASSDEHSVVEELKEYVTEHEDWEKYKPSKFSEVASSGKW